VEFEMRQKRNYYHSYTWKIIRREQKRGDKLARENGKLKAEIYVIKSKLKSCQQRLKRHRK